MSKKYSLVIGRFQPLHAGHIKLIQGLLDKGKYVVVAIRDTDWDEANPYTIVERRQMFEKAFDSYFFTRLKLKVISIPDIEEIVYGRKVGYTIREVGLDKETEAISATKIRKAQACKDSKLPPVHEQ